jgi:hypothetical protein
MRDRKLRQSRRRALGPLTLAALGAFLWVGASAAPARADSNFERGFEDQMGRIMAYEAVNLGKAILFQGVVHPAVHHDTHGHGYAPTTQVVYRDRYVPVHTHAHGKRPVRWGHDDHRRHPGKHYGHAKHDRYDRHDRRGHKDRHDRGHRHDRSCRH